MSHIKQTYKDPVCGMEVSSETAAGQSNYNGKTYYFCSKADKDAFDRNPDVYVVKTIKEPMPH
ncbi:MAG: YHS domain-containing protein [Anaerolineales bacterium]|nr:YHS domain-containing protein [Anaerolineales bacterium]